MDNKEYKLERRELFDRLKTARLNRTPENTIKVTRVKQVKKKDKYVNVETVVETTQEEEEIQSKLFFLNLRQRRELIK